MLVQCDATTVLKQCTKCLLRLPSSEFTKGKGKDGLRYQCRSCNQLYQIDKEKRKEVSSRYYRKRKETFPQLFMWKQAKHRAWWDYGGIEFTIEVGDIQIPERCPYMQVPFIPLDKDFGYSLDRIDSTKGYTKDNIQVISCLANKMKNNATKEQLIAFAKGVLVVHSKEASCDARSM